MRYVAFAAGLLVLLTALFAAVELLGVPILTDPEPHLDGGGAAAALGGFTLLVVDVVLPVPSSVVMTLHGALFGVVGGAALSVAGVVAAAIVGYGVGRRAEPLAARLVAPAERARAEALLRRWGPVAVVITRPVPLLAEATVILAGVSRAGAGRVALAALAGALPIATLYALAGSAAAGFGSTVVVFGAVTVVALLAAAAMRRRFGR